MDACHTVALGVVGTGACPSKSLSRKLPQGDGC